MPRTRSINNTEFRETIVHTVSPYNNGCVGVKATDPTATFQVNNPNVVDLGSPTAQGDWDTATWRAYNGETDNTNSYGIPQFYREGSRVYMDGLIQVIAGQSYTLQDTILTLPEEFRPIKNEIFGGQACSMGIVTGAAGTTNGAAYNCTMYVRNSGVVQIQFFGDINWGTSGTSAGNRYYSAGQGAIVQDTGYTWNGWVSLGGINFRCHGDY